MNVAERLLVALPVITSSLFSQAADARAARPRATAVSTLKQAR
jgi:hypothetical protein